MQPRSRRIWFHQGQPTLDRSVKGMARVAPWIWGERTLYIEVCTIGSFCRWANRLFVQKTGAGYEHNRIRTVAEVDSRPPLDGLQQRWFWCLPDLSSRRALCHMNGACAFHFIYLSEAVLFIKGMRAPQRFALMLYFGFLVLSSFGLWVAVQRVRNKLHGTMVVAVVSLVFSL